MLRGHVFSEQIFGVDIFALFINQFLGGHNGIIESYKNAMEMTNTSNSITIKNGVAVIQGRYVEEHTETVLSYAKTDSLYCSLVIEIDLGKTNTKTSLEQVQYKILEGQNSYPTLTQNDIANQDGNIYQFELARFQNGATGITNFTDRRTYLSFDSVYSGIIQDNLNSDSSTSALSAKQGKLLGQYSTSETIVGTYDGKPLYRKLIKGTFSNNDVLLTNVDSLVNAYGSGCHPNSTIWRLIPYYEYWNNQNFLITVQKPPDSNNVVLKSENSGTASSAQCKITIEYTKTTD